LDLSLFGCAEFTDKPCEELCESISKLKELEVLGLCLKANSFTDKGLEALARCLRGLNQVKKLKILAGDARYLTEEGYKGVIESIKELKDLEMLRINMSNSKEIGDGIMEVIGESMKGKKELRILSLELSKCEVKDEGVEKMMKCVEELGRLEDLSLDLRNCEGVTKKGVKGVYEKLGEVYGMKSEGVSYGYKWIVMKNRQLEED